LLEDKTQELPHTGPSTWYRSSNKDGRIFFIKIVSRTFPDKEAHKRDPRKQMEKDHQSYHQTIPENRLTPFQMGFNMQVVMDPTKAQTKYSWMWTLLEWTNITRHDLITRNLLPKP
jgi:hypothetical protein